jgi:hypothetical protein
MDFDEAKRILRALDQAEDLVVDGIRVRVATPRMLYRMKRDTVRPLDRIDAEAIRERFRLAEEE